MWFLTPWSGGAILTCFLEASAHRGRSRSALRKKLHDFVGGLRLQLGAQVRHLAAHLWFGLLRHRNDRLHDGPVRYRTLRRGGFSALAAAGGSDDRRRHGDAEDGPRAKARLGTDARPQVV